MPKIMIYHHPHKDAEVVAVGDEAEVAEAGRTFFMALPDDTRQGELFETREATPDEIEASATPSSGRGYRYGVSPVNEHEWIVTADNLSPRL